MILKGTEGFFLFQLEERPKIAQIRQYKFVTNLKIGGFQPKFLKIS